jgi:hypothetical protein
MTAVECCFCEGEIEDDAPEVLKIVVSWNDEEITLEWWAHEACFRRSLHPGVRDFPPPSELSGMIDLIKEAGSASVEPSSD